MSGLVFLLLVGTLTVPPGEVDPGQLPPAEGFDCAGPMLVSVPADFPYVNANTTCGAGNDYADTCLGSYDEGEDLIYQLNVTEGFTVFFTLDPSGTMWTAVAVDDVCPADDTCLAQSTHSAGTVHETAVHLEPGTYYVWWTRGLHRTASRSSR